MQRPGLLCGAPLGDASLADASLASKNLYEESLYEDSYEESLNRHTRHLLSDRLLIIASVGLCFLLYITIIGVLSKAGLPLLVAAALVYCLTLLMLITSRSSGKIVVTRDADGAVSLRDADLDASFITDVATDYLDDADRGYGYSRVSHRAHQFRVQ